MTGRIQAAHLAQPTNRVLVISPHDWARYALKREFEARGWEARILPDLLNEESSSLGSFQLILTDSALFPEGCRLESLRNLRATSPSARLILLVGRDEAPMVASAADCGFDEVFPRPGTFEEFKELVEQAATAGGVAVELVPVQAALHFEFVEDQPYGFQLRAAFSTALVHMAGLALILLLPMIFVPELQVQDVMAAWLVAPAPPPAPPPPPAAPAQSQAAAARRIRPVLQTRAGVLLAPSFIPKEVADIVDPENAVVDLGGVEGGVPGGIPGGQMGGVIGGVIGGIGSALPPPAPPPPREPVRVGGSVQRPRLIYRVDPPYPPIAQRLRLTGEVRMDAVIDTDGRVKNLQVLSGHAILAQAALQAVSQWIYEPTLLNGQPVQVRLEITVDFRGAS